MVFGVAESDGSIDKIFKLSKEFPDFAGILHANQPADILKAQEMLRNVVAREASQVDSETLRKKCHIRRFDEFYEYYLSFIAELRSGAIARRMTKERKSKVMQQIRKRGHHA